MDASLAEHGWPVERPLLVTAAYQIAEHWMVMACAAYEYAAQGEFA